MQISSDFPIHSTRQISEAFNANGIRSFSEACLFIQNLPYKRNIQADNPLTVLIENGGTCSTKHTLLKRLAIENNQDQVKLFIGIFAMNSKNIPETETTLELFGLPYLPEAHTYLKWNNQVADFTKTGSENTLFIPDLITEAEVTPEQTQSWKVEYHKEFITGWLNQHPEISYSTEQIWEIRELCIAALANRNNAV